MEKLIRLFLVAGSPNSFVEGTVFKALGVGYI